mmetsp:Transcript_5139/g.12623  ORF Transcript_5139/g.12623 Transcript_5139/m.12623 type:complete len:179 (-) Transcript_5139:11-547(-)
MIFSRLASAALTVLPAFLSVVPAISVESRDLQSGGGYQWGGNKNPGSCTGTLYYFQSEVLVDFDGFDTDENDLTKIRWGELEKSFRESYNSLSEDLCDNSYRRVVDVSINEQPDGNVLIRRGGNQYTLSYTVEAVCRGCDPSSAALFSPPNPDYFRKLVSSDGSSIENVEENPLDTVL